MDQYLLGLINPGLISRIDERSRKRLKRVLLQPNNLYNNTGIFPIQYITTSRNFTDTWWRLNLNSQFFSSSAIAKIMRNEVKIRH